MNQATTTPQLAPGTIAGGAVPLWRWWTSELKALLPATMARWLDGDGIATNVNVDEHGMTVFANSAGTAKAAPSQRVAVDGIATHPVVRELIAAGQDRVRLVLSPEQALVKTISLPLATEENLREVVGFELDRHTPFSPEQAYYDVQVVRRDAQHEKIVVSLAVASKSEVSALIETLRRAGLTCMAIGISSGAAVNAASFDLQPAFDKPPRRLSRMHQINLGLLVFAALLGVVAVVLPIWQKRETVKALIPQVTKSDAEFQISQRVYSEYTKLAGEYNFLAAKKHAAYPVVSVIEELARTFLDTTWVQRLDIKANAKVREVTLLGETQSASKVIENLEQSPLSLFQNSKQLTSATRTQPNTERFHVSTEIKPRPIPPAESIEDVVLPAVLAPVSKPAASAATPTIPTATVSTVPPAAAPADQSANKSGGPAQAPAPSSPALAAPASPPLSTFNGPPPAPTQPVKEPVQPKMPPAKRSSP